MEQYDNETIEYQTLKPKHKAIAAYHVTNPEASQAECYWTQYPNAKKTSARQRGSKLFNTPAFRDYCETLRTTAAVLATENIKQARLQTAIIDPTSQEAISVLAEMATVAYETLDQDYRTTDFAVTGYGKGMTEVTQFYRPLNHGERMNAARFVRDTTQINRKEAVPTATVVIQRLDSRPVKPVIEADLNDILGLED